MRKLGALLASGVWCVLGAACGGDRVGQDPGRGSRSLLVDGDLDIDGEGAEFRVTVDRDGQDVDDAVVTVRSDGGEATLALVGGGEYGGGQRGWNDWYDLEVRAGDDWLEGGIEAPDLPVVVEPGDSLDPHAVEGGLVRVAWAGEGAMTVRVRVGDFDDTLPDEGAVMVPAATFDEEQIDVEVRRQNAVDLAGGAPGSRLRAESRTEATIFVTNPF